MDWACPVCKPEKINFEGGLQFKLSNHFSEISKRAEKLLKAILDPLQNCTYLDNTSNTDFKKSVHWTVLHLPMFYNCLLKSRIKWYGVGAVGQIEI